jgi:Bacterial extracellular solute-binding proteins, family 5 Middle
MNIQVSDLDGSLREGTPSPMLRVVKWNRGNVRARLLMALLVAVIGLAGCHPAPPAGPDLSQTVTEPALWPGSRGDLDTRREHCDPLPDEALPGGSFLFALTDSVLPRRAPVPHNPSERIVFAQLYETLVNMDCSGVITPGLADQWTCTQDSTVWVFRVRQDARFWDGSRVNAADIKQAWCGNQTCAGGLDRITPWAWFNARASTITVLDAHRLSIRLPEPQADFPSLLTHPATAVAVHRDGWTWPLGSGPCRLRATTPPPLPELVCRPNPQHPLAPIWKQLTFLVQPGRDPRDLIATGFHLAQVGDLESVRFFTEAAECTVTPLPWNRLYLLVCSPQANPSGTRRWLDPARQLDPGREMTRIAARSWPEIVLPAGAGSACPQLNGPVALSGSARLDWNLEAHLLDENTLVFDALDPGARELAQRLAALGDAMIRTAGLPRPALSFTLQWQMAGSYIVPMDLDFPTTCLQFASLLGRASWLQQAALTGRLQTVAALDPNSLAAAERASSAPVQDPRRNLVRLELVHPLALTHPWLVTRGDMAGLRLTFDGTPLLSGLGPRAAETGLP